MKAKFILLVVLSLFLTACEAYNTGVESNISFFDYEKFNRDGFYFSPLEYNGKFKMISSLKMDITFEKSTKEKPLDTKNQFWVKMGHRQYYKYQIASEFAPLLIEKAKEKGADAIVLFNYTFKKFPENNGIIFTAYAIDRLDN